MQIAVPKRQLSFRAKVRRALGVVLLVTLPQLVLTLYYLDEVRKTADALASQVALLHEVELIRNPFMRLAIPEPAAITAESRLRIERSLTEIADRANAVADSYPSQVQGLRHVSVTAEEMIAATREWDAAMERVRRDSGPPRPHLQASRTPGLGEIDVGTYHDKVTTARLAVDDALFAIVVALLDEVRAQNVAAEATLAHADRNLVTLVMVAVVVILALLLILPNALVGPLRKLTRAIRAAAVGRSGARVEVPADDEIGEMATAFNETMDTLRQFDAMKRDRIIEDGGKVDTLLRHAGGPAAILSPQLTVEAANREFLKLFGSQIAEGETPIPEVVRTGRSDLEELLTRAREHRHEVLRHALRLQVLEGEVKDYRATVDVCRDRRSRPTHLLLVLGPWETRA